MELKNIKLLVIKKDSDGTAPRKKEGIIVDYDNNFLLMKTERGQELIPIHTIIRAEII